MAVTPDGKGYWLVARNGNVFSFGDARFSGPTAASHVNRPVVGIVAARSGNGYWLVTADGNVFSFGSAKFYGPSVQLAPRTAGGRHGKDRRRQRLLARDRKRDRAVFR